MAALATQASIAITNANLMDQLARSRTRHPAPGGGRAGAARDRRQPDRHARARRRPPARRRRVGPPAARRRRGHRPVRPRQRDPALGLRLGHQRRPARGRQADQPAPRRGRLGQGRGRGPGHHRRRLHGRRVPARRAGRLAGRRRGPARPHRRPDHRREPDRSGPSRCSAGRRTRSTRSTRRSSGSLAEQAAIAITNARLIEELRRSQTALARRAETERSLRDITARIAALHDPEAGPGAGRRGRHAPARHRRRAPDPDGTRPGRTSTPVVVAGAPTTSTPTG